MKNQEIIDVALDHADNSADWQDAFYTKMESLAKSDIQYDECVIMHSRQSLGSAGVI